MTKSCTLFKHGPLPPPTSTSHPPDAIHMISVHRLFFSALQCIKLNTNQKKKSGEGLGDTYCSGGGLGDTYCSGGGLGDTYCSGGGLGDMYCSGGGLGDTYCSGGGLGDIAAGEAWVILQRGRPG